MLNKEITELEITSSDDKFFDFGVDAFGQLELVITSTGGKKIEVAIGEVAENGKINPTPGGYRCYKKATIDALSGTWVYKFNIPEHVPPYHLLPKCHSPKQANGEIAPFRYVEVKGAEGRVKARRIAYYQDFPGIGDFYSSDEFLNQIWNFCKYSIKATTVFGKYIDGERERLPYEGDTYINQLGHFVCGTDFSIAKATIDHELEYPTWPTEWQLLMPIIVRDYLYYSGDEESVAKWLPALKKSVLLSLAKKDSLIAGNDKIRDIVDWPMTERDNYEFGEVNFVPNAYHYASLLALAELSKDDSYLAKAQAVKADLRKYMLKDGLFVDSPDSNHTSLHTAVFALIFNIAEGDEIEALKNIITSKGMACSVYVAQFLLESCFMHNLDDYALSLITSKDLRSWGNMLAKGATISMEAWDDTFKPNQDWNHAWGAAPANIIPRFVAGIRPLEKGFKKFIVDPHPGNLEFFNCIHPVADGVIEINYRASWAKVKFPPGYIAVYNGKEYKEEFSFQK